MELFIHKFVTISDKKIFGNNSSEIHFVGTNLHFPFVNNDENLGLESKYSVNLKDIKQEIDSIRNVSKTIIVKNGEPCIQSLGLKTIARYVKQRNLFFGLETYGTKPSLVKELIDNKLVDLIILKAYFPLQNSWLKKINKSSLREDFDDVIESVKKTIRMLQDAKIKINARTIIVPSLLYKKAEINSIAKSLVKINNVTYKLVPFKPDNCSKMLMNIKEPSSDFMNDIKNELKASFPSLRVK